MIDITGPPNATFSLWLCQQFASGPTMAHTVFPQGSWALDTTTGNTALVTSGTFTSSGSASLKVVFGKPVPTGFLEAETYVQLAIVRTDSTAAFSNRLRLDLDRN
jgi:hypothetical protein